MYEAGTLPAATMMEHAISFGESGRKKKATHGVRSF